MRIVSYAWSYTAVAVLAHSQPDVHMILQVVQIFARTRVAVHTIQTGLQQQQLVTLESKPSDPTPYCTSPLEPTSRPYSSSVGYTIDVLGRVEIGPARWQTSSRTACI